MEVLNSLKTFSESHAEFIDALLNKIQSHYGQSLVSLCIYGSYAQKKNRLNSDLDLLIILQRPSGTGRLKRQEEFVREVENGLDRIWEKSEAEGISMEISPLILNTKEANSFLPLYLDMVEHHVILVDKECFLKKRLATIQKQMERWGSKKYQIGNHWYWDICPRLKRGEEIDYDQ